MGKRKNNSGRLILFESLYEVSYEDVICKLKLVKISKIYPAKQ